MCNYRVTRFLLAEMVLCALCNQSAQAQQAPGLLLLTNGDRLRGALAASDNPAEIVWRSPAFAAPLHFALDRVRSVRFDAAPAAPQSDYRLILSSGDELYGSLISVDDDAMVMQTRQAAALRIKRTAIASLSRCRAASAARSRLRPFVIDKEHVLGADGKILYGELIGYHADAQEFLFQVGAERASRRADDIAEIAFRDVEVDRDALVRLEYSDGARLSGKLLRIGDDDVQINSPSLFEIIGMPRIGLRYIRASAGQSTSRSPGPRRRDEAVLTIDEGQLHGRLVGAQPHEGQTCLAWQPAGASNAATLRDHLSASIDFVPSVLPDLAGEDGGDDKVFLHDGDILKCRVAAMDGDEAKLHLAGSSLKRVPSARIKAVEFGRASRKTIADDKRARLLTLPRLQRDDPPTHLLGSLGGDYLRGRLLAVSESHVSFEVGGARRELPRDRIGCLIWLDAGEERSAEKLISEQMQITDADGQRLSFIASKIEDGWIIGTSELLGDCRWRLNQLSELRIGPEKEPSKRAAGYQAWRLTDAILPNAFAGEADADERGEASDLVGRPAADFTIELLDGAKFQLSKQRGKVVVLDFWASWCAPCVKGLPDIAALFDDLDAEQVRFLAVNLQESRDDAARAVARMRLSVAVGLDRDGRVAKSYGAGSIPYTVVIDGGGKVARVFVGYGPRLAEELKQAIAREKQTASERR